MRNFVFVGDLLEENGKTVKENNLGKIHTIPINTLVEITYQDDVPEQDHFGCRLFVVRHDRDCDGTPLYALSHKRTSAKELQQAERDFDKCTDPMERALISANIWSGRGALVTGYDEESLKVIKLPEGQEG